MAIQDDFYNKLPKKRIASGALLFDEQGHILLVKPTYKQTWEVPGGITEIDESPKTGCEREIKEELGIEVTVSELLCMDYVANHDDKGDSLQMIFDGGILSDRQIAAIRLTSEELSEYRFFAPNNIDAEFKDKLRLRIQKAIEAKKTGRAIYLENPNK